MKIGKYNISLTKDNKIEASNYRSLLWSSLGADADAIDTSSVAGQAKAYAKCPVLMSIILKKVSAIQNARLMAVDRDNNEVVKLKELELFSRPNNAQDIKEFIGSIELMMSVFGKAYIIKQDIVGFDGSFELYVIPNTCVTENRFVDRGLSFYPDADIKDYTINICGSQANIDKDHVFIIKDKAYDLNAYGGSASRLEALKHPINTFVSSYDAVHELMVNRGMLAIISLTTGSQDLIKDAVMPEVKSDKEAVQQALSKYGVLSGKLKYAVTALKAAVTPVSSTITDLGLTDVQRACKKDIADMYHVPSVLLDVEGSTYANAKEAKTILYNDAIIPDASNIFSVLNKIYGFSNFQIMPYYDHLEFFQEAKRQQAAGMTNLVSALTNAVNSGLLSQTEARDELMKYIV